LDVVTLTDTQSRIDFFHQAILENLRYWNSWIEDKTANVTALDRERNNIVRAILFAFGLDDGWSPAYRLLNTISTYMERRGHWETWNQVLSHAIEASQRNEDMTSEVTLSILLARLMFQQGRFKDAIGYYRRTIRISRKIGDYFNEARACTNLGYYYVEHGLWYRAKVLCCHALKSFEDIDNNHGRAHTENHLGILYIKQHQWELAQHHLEQACSIWQTMEDNHGLMWGYLNLGALFNDNEQPDKAQVYLEKALHLAELTGDEATMGRIYLNLGLTHTLGDNLTEAEASVRRAEAIFQQYANTAELARTWDSLAAIYFRRGRRSEAILLLERALEVWRHLNNKIDRINTVMKLIEYELARENREQAVKWLEEVEELIGSDLGNSSYRDHQSRLIEVYRSLTEQAAID